MKVRVVTHSLQECIRERKHDLPKLQHNPDPALHPFQRPREVARALNATKLERLFAQPFIKSFEGHVDGVYALAKHYKKLPWMVSGSADGELRLWDLAGKTSIWNCARAHSRFIRGVAFRTNSDTQFVSCSDDSSIKLWDIGQGEPEISRFLGASPFTAVDCHYYREIFGSAGRYIDIWDYEHPEPVQRFEWGNDTFVALKFNIAEPNVFGTCGNDRGIALYDLRMSAPLSKCILTMRSNAICWNPMEAFNFTVANEDHCCYSFDMRRLDHATNILKDHVSAVMDLDYSPTGEEIVTGAYDRSIRIFNSKHGHSRDVYHTKRMQKVFSVRFTMDSRYIVSSGDDGSIRLWRSNASERHGYKTQKQLDSLSYSETLKRAYRDIPEIKRISRHRHLPRSISSVQRENRIIRASMARKEENRRKHSKPGAVPYINKRKACVVSVEE